MWGEIQSPLHILGPDDDSDDDDNDNDVDDDDDRNPFVRELMRAWG